MPETTPTPTAPSIGWLTTRFAEQIASTLSSGDVALLRRGLDRGRPEPGALRLALRYLPEVDDRNLSRWVVALGAMAHLKGLHRPGYGLGRALADVGCAEMRVARLLQAQGSGFQAQIRSVVQMLATRAAGFDQADLARLLLVPPGDSAEEIRRRVASDYYRTLQQQEAKGA